MNFFDKIAQGEALIRRNYKTIDEANPARATERWQDIRQIAESGLGGLGNTSTRLGWSLIKETPLAKGIKSTGRAPELIGETADVAAEKASRQVEPVTIPSWVPPVRPRVPFNPDDRRIDVSQDPAVKKPVHRPKKPKLRGA